MSTIALVVPIVLLRRHKANVLARAMQEAPPPPRRTTSMAASTMGRANASLPTGSLVMKESTLDNTPSQNFDDFNGALHSAKAFGYATLMVAAGATFTLWGVKSYMDVHDVGVCTPKIHFTQLKTVIFPDSRVRGQDAFDHTGSYAQVVRTNISLRTRGSRAKCHQFIVRRR